MSTRYVSATLFAIVPLVFLMGGVTNGALAFAPPDRSPEIAEKPAIHDTFEEAFVPVGKGDPASPSVITGSLPPHWTEDSTWQGANVSVKYERLGKGAYQGKGALRITVSAVTAGRAQLRYDGVPLSTSHYLRLHLAIHSPTSSSVRIGIRKGSPPWTDYWSQSVTAAPEWRSVDCLIAPVADDPQAQFVLYFDQAAVIDIDDISLTSISEADVLKSRPDAFAGNLLPSSSFPDGLAKPWQRSSGSPLTTYQADPSVLGPTGLPALRVHPVLSGGGFTELTAPFLGKPGANHTFSVYLRGSRAGQSIQMRIGPPSEPLYVAPYQQTVNLTTDWQRYTFTLPLPPAASGFYIARLTDQSPGDIWIDGVEVEVGGAATPFRRTGKAEMQLFPSKNLGLYFAGEPLELNATIYGAIPAGASLRGKLTDIAGHSFPLDRVPLPGGRLQRRHLTITPRGELPLGTYVASITAYDGDGHPVSKEAEALLHRVRPPRNANLFVPDSPFGVHIAPMTELARAAHDLGFKWVRQFGTYEWMSSEIAAGQWDWREADRVTDLMRANKLMILGVMGGVPARASYLPPDFHQWNPGAAAARQQFLPAWEDYAYQLARHFRGRVMYWETWNEPDWPEFFFTDYKDGKYVHGQAAQIATMSRIAGAALHRADPANHVFWNRASAVVNRDFNNQAIGAGILDTADGVSYHTYIGGGIGYPGDQFAEVIGVVKNDLPANRKNLPIWNTEGGPGPTETHNAYLQTPPLGLRDRENYWSDYLVRYYVSTLSQGVRKFFLYEMYEGDWWPNYSMLNADGSLAPNSIAFSNLAWHLEGRRFVSVQPLAAGINAYLFAGKEGSVAVLLSHGIGRVSLNASPGKRIHVRDLYGNDVRFPTTLGTTASFISGDGITAAQLLKQLQAAISNAVSAKAKHSVRGYFAN